MCVCACVRVCVCVVFTPKGTAENFSLKSVVSEAFNDI